MLTREICKTARGVFFLQHPYTGCSETEFHIENPVIFDVELRCSNYVIFEIVCFKTEFHIQKHKTLEILIVRIRNYRTVYSSEQCTRTAVQQTPYGCEVHGRNKFPNIGHIMIVPCAAYRRDQVAESRRVAVTTNLFRHSKSARTLLSSTVCVHRHNSSHT